MPLKRALIVDDSKTAQFKLKRDLGVYELTVDCASSAEDALSYLSYKVPDIIFMDHSMQGMTGLDAVRIIKSNAATATIPVVMYTAETGDLYLSQARAIGAIDVLSKDVMTGSDIDRVMQSVNISRIKQPKNVDQDARQQSQQTVPLAEPNQELIKIRDQVANSLDIQQGKVRRDIQDNTRLLIKRFMREIRGVREEMARHQKRRHEFETLQLNDAEKKSKQTPSAWLITTLLLLLGIASYSMIELSRVKQENATLLADTRSLTMKITQQSDLINANASSAREATLEQTRMRADQLLSALVWAINQKGQYEFSEQALGDNRISMVSGLIDHLNHANFKGTLTLGIHSGDFCVVFDDNGYLELPEEPVTVSDCELLSSVAASFESTSQTSMSFINFLDSSPIIERGDLQVKIESHGVSAPSYEYPAMAADTSAQDWNLAAASNNRLTVSLNAQ